MHAQSLRSCTECNDNTQPYPADKYTSEQHNTTTTIPSWRRHKRCESREDSEEARDVVVVSHVHESDWIGLDECQHSTFDEALTQHTHNQCTITMHNIELDEAFVRYTTA